MTGMDAKTTANTQLSPFEMLLASGRAFEMTLPDGTHIEVPATTAAPNQPCTPPCTPSVYTAPAIEPAPEATGEAANPDSASGDATLATPDDVHREDDVHQVHQTDVHNGVHEMVSPQAVTVYTMFATDGVLTGALVSQRLGVSRAHACNLLTELFTAGLASKAGRGKYTKSLASPPHVPAASPVVPTTDDGLTCTPPESASPPDGFTPEYQEIRERDSNSVTLSPIPSSTLLFYEVESKDKSERGKREVGTPDSPANQFIHNTPSPPPPTAGYQAAVKVEVTAGTKKPRTRCEDCGEYISVRLRQQGSDVCESCRAAEEADEAMMRAEARYLDADADDDDEEPPDDEDDDNEWDDDDAVA